MTCFTSHLSRSYLSYLSPEVLYIDRGGLGLQQWLFYGQWVLSPTIMLPRCVCVCIGIYIYLFIPFGFTLQKPHDPVTWKWWSQDKNKEPVKRSHLCKGAEVCGGGLHFLVRGGGRQGNVTCAYKNVFIGFDWWQVMVMPPFCVWGTHSHIGLYDTHIHPPLPHLKSHWLVLLTNIGQKTIKHKEPWVVPSGSRTPLPSI